MAYNDKLAGRVRIALAGERASEKQMMRSLYFMVRGPGRSLQKEMRIRLKYGITSSIIIE